MPKISVIVPVYNVEKYLRQCIDSILAQTFADFELILVDDGSPDKCGAICDEYAEKDARIRVFHQANKGVSTARNFGLDCANGEAIMFVDADDWIDNNALEILFDLLKKENAEISICNVDIFCGIEHFIDDNCPISDEVLSRSNLVAKLIEPQAWYYITFNKMMKRSLFDTIRFPDGYFHEDNAVIHRLVAQCGKIVTTSKKLYHYRQTEGSTMHSGLTLRRTDNLFALADRIYFSYIQEWTNMHKATIQRFVHTFFEYYLMFAYENVVYRKRMEKSLKIALPYILKDGSVKWIHKIYMLIIAAIPSLYLKTRRFVKKVFLRR